MREVVRKSQGERLREARQRAGFRSAREAALENSWPESTYRAHEAGQRTIGQDDAERYAKRFRAAGVSVTAKDLLFGPDKNRQGNPAHQENVSSDGLDAEAVRAALEVLLHVLCKSDLAAREAAEALLSAIRAQKSPPIGLDRPAAVRFEAQQIADRLVSKVP